MSSHPQSLGSKPVDGSGNASSHAIVAGSPAHVSIRKYHATHEDVIVDERDKSDKKTMRRWIHRSDQTIIEVPVDAKSSIGFSFRSLRQMALDAFLPIGYPHSVSPDYLEYQMYDSLQAFFSTITSLLANRAVLQGLGVGDASKTATHALLLTILKDAISRVATITFAYRFGLAIEPDAKRYRFLADVFNDSAFFLDLASPYLGTWGKILALTVAEALRALCGVTAGASKAALSSHFARSNNLAELNAKEASQETAVGLCGLFFGSIIVKYIERRQTVFILMILLVFAHLYMNYRGVRCVQLNVLNQQRATILMQHFFHSGGDIMTPEQVAKKESIIFWEPIVLSKNGDVGAHLSMATSYADMTPDWSEDTGYIIAWKKVGKVCHGKIFLAKVDQPLEVYCAIKAWYMGVATGCRRGSPTSWGTQELMERDNFFRLATGAGWDISEHGLETGIPFRVSIRAVPGRDDEKKEQ